MKTKEFSYFLPKELIAQERLKPNDQARLLVLDRKEGTLIHSYFYQIDKFLKKSDVLVFNQSKVIPARLIGRKEKTGGKVEILLLRPNLKSLKNYRWQKQWRIIARPGISQGEKIIFPLGLRGVVKNVFNYERLLEFNFSGEKLKKIVYQIGQPPLPPYIKKKTNLEDYQTIYARSLGSVAAPTAGFHFTKRLIKKLKKKGIIFQFITLHIGLGTFKPIKTEEIENHQMEEEWVEIDRETANFLNRAKRNSQRIIAVGTTVVRALESFANKKNHLKAGSRFVNLFIYPSYQFKFVDALITNFHLPQSTPLLLVSAFAGKDLIWRAYQEAIKEKYRFFSFGDAMLII